MFYRINCIADFEPYPDLGFGVNYPKFEFSEAAVPQDKLLLPSLSCLLNTKANWTP